MQHRPKPQAPQDQQPLRHPCVGQVIQADDRVHPLRADEDRHHKNFLGGERQEVSRAPHYSRVYIVIYTQQVLEARPDPQHAPEAGVQHHGAVDDAAEPQEH